MIADVVIIVAMKFIEKGVVAEAKLKELQEQHMEQNREMDKGQKLARNARTRAAAHNATKGKGKTPKNSGKHNHNIQQPSKQS